MKNYVNEEILSVITPEIVLDYYFGYTDGTANRCRFNKIIKNNEFTVNVTISERGNKSNYGTSFKYTVNDLTNNNYVGTVSVGSGLND